MRCAAWPSLHIKLSEMSHKKFQRVQPYHGPSFVLHYVVQFSDKDIQYAGHFWQTDVLYNLTFVCP